MGGSKCSPKGADPAAAAPAAQHVEGERMAESSGNKLDMVTCPFGSFLSGLVASERVISPGVVPRKGGCGGLGRGSSAQSQTARQGEPSRAPRAGARCRALASSLARGFARYPRLGRASGQRLQKFGVPGVTKAASAAAAGQARDDCSGPAPAALLSGVMDGCATSAICPAPSQVPWVIWE